MTFALSDDLHMRGDIDREQHPERIIAISPGSRSAPGEIARAKNHRPRRRSQPRVLRPPTGSMRMSLHVIRRCAARPPANRLDPFGMIRSVFHAYQSECHWPPFPPIRRLAPADSEKSRAIGLLPVRRYSFSIRNRSCFFFISNINQMQDSGDVGCLGRKLKLARQFEVGLEFTLFM